MIFAFLSKTIEEFRNTFFIKHFYKAQLQKYKTNSKGEHMKQKVIAICAVLLMLSLSFASATTIKEKTTNPISLSQDQGFKLINVDYIDSYKIDQLTFLTDNIKYENGAQFTSSFYNVYASNMYLYATEDIAIKSEGTIDVDADLVEFNGYETQINSDEFNVYADSQIEIDAEEGIYFSVEEGMIDFYLEDEAEFSVYTEDGDITLDADNDLNLIRSDTNIYSNNFLIQSPDTFIESNSTTISGDVFVQDIIVSDELIVQGGEAIFEVDDYFLVENDQGNIDLEANEGDIEIQSHHGNIELVAQDEVYINSDDLVYLSAKDTSIRGNQELSIKSVNGSAKIIGETETQVIANQGQVLIKAQTQTTIDGKVSVQNGDLEIDSVSGLYGVVLRSPSGAQWRITVDDNGTLTTQAVY
jgi:uncharacterized protein (DUF2345 family)